jgi:CBS domain-containing protein
MIVKEIMNKKVKHIDPNLSLQEAAMIMSEVGFSALPVVERGHVVGIITRKDLIVRALAKHVDPQHTTVKKIMTLKVHSANEQDTLEALAKKMAIYAIHSMPVLDDAKKIVGFVTLEDLIKRGSRETWNKLVMALNRAA